MSYTDQESQELIQGSGALLEPCLINGYSTDKGKSLYEVYSMQDESG